MGLFSWFGVISTAHASLARVLAGGRYVGTDSLGNRYYQAPARKGYRHARRFVMYRGRPEASSVQPEWHGWLHHQTDAVPSTTGPTYRRPWQLPSQPNLTGTTSAYRPPGYDRPRNDATAAAPGIGPDYEAWTPPE